MLKIESEFSLMSERAINIAYSFHLPEIVKVSPRLTIVYNKKPENLIISGMGGSAIGGLLLSNILSDEIKIPVFVVQDYHLPAFANENTLLFLTSYSGDTEEILSAFVEALQRRCMIIAISSGGYLLKYCDELKIPYIKVPKGYPPRSAFPFIFFPMLILLQRMGLISNKDEDVRECLSVLRSLEKSLSPDVPVEMNEAKNIALELEGYIPVIYASRDFRGVAIRMKTQFNENSKIPARYEFFPELDHNEIVGWEELNELNKKFAVILLRELDEEDEIKLRIELTKEIISNRVGKLIELQARGKSKLSKTLSLLLLGDFISLYLAILRGVDPFPVRSIDELKEKMKSKLDLLKKIDREIFRLKV